MREEHYRCANHKLGTIQKKQWGQTDILELVPLKELPSELKWWAFITSSVVTAWTNELVTHYRDA